MDSAKVQVFLDKKSVILEVNNCIKANQLAKKSLLDFVIESLEGEDSKMMCCQINDVTKGEDFNPFSSIFSTLGDDIEITAKMTEQLFELLAANIGKMTDGKSYLVYENSVWQFTD